MEKSKDEPEHFRMPMTIMRRTDECETIEIDTRLASKWSKHCYEIAWCEVFKTC